MKRSVILFILFFGLHLTAQTKIYKLKEYDNRKDTVSALFAKLGRSYRSDTVCVIFMLPGSCPRCEGTLNPFIQELQKQRPAIEVISFVFNNNKEASADYMTRHKFNTTTDYFFYKDVLYKNFKVSTNRMMTPFVLLFHSRTGIMLNSEGMLGYTVDSTNVSKFLTETKPDNELYEYKENSVQVGKERPLGYDSLFKIDIVNRFDIPTNTFKISDANFLDVKALGVFKFTDGMTHQIIFFNAKNNRLLKIKPSRYEERLFVKIAEEEFLGMKKMNIARTMYFKSNFLNDSVITISTSLPDISYTKPHHINYSNKAGLLSKNIFTDSVYSFVNFRFTDSIFVISHVSASFSETGNYIYVPLKKGWPAVGVDDKYLKNPALNPFSEKFYTNTPVFAIFDREGNFVTYGGQLSSIVKHARMGYFISNPKIKFIDNQYYFTSSSDGVLYISTSYDLRTITDSIMINPSLATTSFTSAVNKEDQPLEYLLDIYNMYFSYKIVDFTIHNKIVYIIVKNDQTGVHYLYKYQQDLKRLSYAIIENTSDSEINDVKFYLSKEKQLNLFTINSNDVKPHILKYSFKD